MADAREKAEVERLKAELRADPESLPNLLRINREYASRCEEEIARLKAEVACYRYDTSKADIVWHGEIYQRHIEVSAAVEGARDEGRREAAEALETMLRAAYRAGFNSSCEGANGECFVVALLGGNFEDMEDFVVKRIMGGDASDLPPVDPEWQPSR